MGLNQVVFMQSTNTTNKNHSTGYIKEVVSKFQRHMARSVLKLQNNKTCLLSTIVELVEDAQEEITNSKIFTVNLVTEFFCS